MGYGNPDLDEISTQELVDELIRRKEVAKEKECPYCGQPINTHTCKFVGKVDVHYGGHFGPINISFATEKKS